MASKIKCPNGHWFDPGSPGGVQRCPYCKAQSPTEKKSLSDDDILSMLDSPPAAAPPEENIEAAPPPEPRKSLHGPVILRRNKKVCPRCAHEMSVSFEHCPRCGEPLKVVSTEL